MDWKTTLNVSQIILSIILVVVILLQQQGSGLGSMFGNVGGESYRSKRGAEKLFYNATIILIVLFIVNGLAIAILSANS
ncbi:MAG TPA: preprotein translocase subunit SecG [Candidatus Dojkabacteria bacterium]|jgi:preprotein translocase subunit SecG|nr:preprotein translocase subunit SecG [Candidatus Dojkabacteria bacterium]